MWPLLHLSLLLEHFYFPCNSYLSFIHFIFLAILILSWYLFLSAHFFFKDVFIISGGHVFLYVTEVARIYWNFILSSFLKFPSSLLFLFTIDSFLNERKVTWPQGLLTVRIWRWLLAYYFSIWVLMKSFSEFYC